MWRTQGSIPTRERFRHIGADSESQPRQVDVETGVDVGREDGNNASNSGIPESESGLFRGMVPVPSSPSLAVQLPSPHVPSGKHPHSESSFDRARKPSRAPRADGAQFDEMTWDQLPDSCSRRGFRNKESKAALKTRLTTMGAAEEKRNLRENPQDKGKRGRAPVLGVKVSDIPPGISGPHSTDRKRDRAPAKGEGARIAPHSFRTRPVGVGTRTPGVVEKGNASRRQRRGPRSRIIPSHFWMRMQRTPEGH